MAEHTEKNGVVISAIATGAITKRRFIGFDNAVCNAIGEHAKGVSRENDTDLGKSFEIVVTGSALVEAGEALDAGMLATTNGLGKAIRATKGRYVNGVVLRSQALAGQNVEILLGGPAVATAPTTTSTTTTTTTSSSSTTTTTAA